VGGEWKDADTIAEEWEAKGAQVPQCFSNAKAECKTIDALINMVSKDPQLSQLVNEIVFVPQ
jgi:hypothetical protein